ncbi:hypothetical protein RQN30_02350 [Arcanobacterium hippocoleae]
MHEHDLEILKRRLKQDRLGRPVSLRGSVIRAKQMEMLSVLKQLRCLCAHTPIQNKAFKLINSIGEIQQDVNAIVMEIELAQ